jgi:hypothetical protein
MSTHQGPEAEALARAEGSGMKKQRESASRRTGAVTVVSALAALLCGCSSSGVKVSQATASQFVAGHSTCADVKARLGEPNVIRPSAENSSKIVYIYSYSATQAHPENFIPMVGAFVGGADQEATVAAFRFSPDCVLDATRYASLNSGSGVNLEGVAQERKDTGTAD